MTDTPIKICGCQLPWTDEEGRYADDHRATDRDNKQTTKGKWGTVRRSEGIQAKVFSWILLPWTKICGLAKFWRRYRKYF